MSEATVSSDYDAIKTRQRTAWGAGDYCKIGSTVQFTGEQLAEALALRPGSRALDVAAGNGNITLALARRSVQVTSTDFVEALLERSRARAVAEGFDIDYRVADAEQLPFEDGEFDAVVSTFGVMFTPNQERSARELMRVCRSGGRIGLLNWTPTSFIGRLFEVLGRHVPPPPGVRSPARWGDEAWLQENFGAGAAGIEIDSKDFMFVSTSPEDFLATWRQYYGPITKAFVTVGDDGAAALEADILALLRELDVATDGTMRVPGEYLEVRIRKA